MSSVSQGEIALGRQRLATDKRESPPKNSAITDPITVSRQLLVDVHKAMPKFRTGRFLILSQRIADALAGASATEGRP